MEKSTTVEQKPAEPVDTSSGYITYILGFIFLVIVLILVVYFWQINARNLPPVPVITDFGVTINNLSFDRQVVAQEQTFNGGTATAFVAAQSGVMVMVDRNVVLGEGSTGWILTSLNKSNQNIVTIRNAYTGNYIVYFVDDTGLPMNGGVLQEESDISPTYYPTTFPKGTALGWFMLVNLPTVINTNTKLSNAVVQFKAINIATPYFISIGPQAPSGPTDNYMTLQSPSAQIQNTFALSIGG